jgi:hypothetical protein
VQEKCSEEGMNGHTTNNTANSKTVYEYNSGCCTNFTEEKTTGLKLENIAQKIQRRQLIDFCG